MSMGIREYLRRDSEVTCEFTFPLSAVDTYMERLLEKDKRDLAKELLLLRESSKDALEKSWNEAQNLERLSANRAEVINQLKVQLIEAQSEETEWRLRCLEAEKKQAIQSGSRNQTKNMSTGRQLSEYLEETMETTFRDKIRSSMSSGNMSSMSRESTRRFSAHFIPTIRFWPTKGLSGVKDGGTKMQSRSDHLMSMSNVYNDSSKAFSPTIRSWPTKGLPGVKEGGTKMQSRSDHLMSMSNMYDDSSKVFSPTIRSWPTKGLPGVKEGCTKMQSRSDHLMSMSNMYDDSSKASEDFLVGTSVHSISTIYSENTVCINGNAKTKEDLSLIISSRDQIIANLEQTLNQNMESMHKLQAEMQCLMESQRTKEEQLRIMHKEKEGKQNKVIESLRKQLKEEEEITKEKYKSLIEYKLYIQELTDELEKVLKIVNKAEKCGFV